MSSSVPLWIVLLATTVFSMVGCLDSKNVHQLTSEIPDYEVLDQLTNGERELRVHFKGMYAKDTTFDSLDHGQRFKLRLVQASDGYRFIQAIYDRNDVLSDCEYVKDVAQSFEFIEFFKSDIDALFDASDNLGHLQKNFTLTSKKKTVSRSSFRFISDRQDLSDRASEILNYHRLRKACKKLHMTLMSATRERSQRFGANGIRSILRRRRRDVDEEEEEEEEEPKEGMTIMPGTLWCGAGNISPKFTDLGAYTGADLCCREHDHCPSKLGPFEKKFGLLNLRPHTILHCHCDEREKRALVDIARIPYTKWCGSGNRADHQNDLGSYAGTDKCCRIHDTVCPMSINALSTGYGYYNHNLYTMSHCSCDERFRTCLQQTGTGASNMVGEIFFNIIKTKCFVIKKEKVCARRSWWGNCTRYRYKKTAISRDPMPY